MLEFVILYFSGTGNTEKITDEIRKRLIRCNVKTDVFSVEEFDKIKSYNFTDKIIGIGFPVYKFTYPDNIIEILNHLKLKAPKNDYFVFNTYTRFPSDSINDIISELSEGKINVRATEEFKAPSCGISSRLDESHHEYQTVMFFEPYIDKKIDNFVRKVLNIKNESKINPKRITLKRKVIKRIVNRIEQIKYPKLQIDYKKCTSCGLCVKKCPDDNLVSRGEKVVIKSEEDCLHCLRCISVCPNFAIYFGLLTKGNNRYSIKKRNELYEKSLSGYSEHIWKRFPKIIKKWRRNTLYYYMKHFFKGEIQ